MIRGLLFVAGLATASLLLAGLALLIMRSLAPLARRLVETLEPRPRHIDLAPHLQKFGVVAAAQVQRNRGDCPHVVGDVNA